MKSDCGVCGLSHRRLNVRIENRTLKRRAKSSKHFLRSFGAWAFDAHFFESHQGDFDKVEITDTDTGAIYLASCDVFARFGFRQDLGRGLQIILGLNRWTISSGNRSAARSVRRLVQLPLFRFW